MGKSTEELARDAGSAEFLEGIATRPEDKSLFRRILEAILWAIVRGREEEGHTVH